MADADRDALIARATAVAERLLPTAEEVAAATGPDPDGRLLPLWLVAASLGGAVLLGTAVAFVGGDTPVGSHGAAPTFDPDSPSPTASPTPSATPSVTATATRTSRPSATSTATATATRSASATPPATYDPQPGDEQITLSRTVGRNDTEVTVRGFGWKPGLLVRLSYHGPLGPTGSTAEAVPDANGEFVTRIVCHDPQNIPGPHTIRATNGSQSTSASFTAT
jgi:hypothetical protein